MRARSAVAWVVPLFTLVACAPEDVGERLRGDCGEGFDVIQEAAVTHTPGCGGCDTSCWLSTDTPSGAGDVRVIAPNKNGESVGWDGGVVLSSFVPGPDTDLDGLADAVDPTPANANGDADGDGYPDSWEVHNGTDPLVKGASPPAGNIYVVLPYLGGAVTKTLPPSIPLTVRAADIYFLIDTTGSMDGEILNLRSTLSTYVVPEVAKKIPDVQYGVGRVQDFGGDLIPYRNLINITSNTANVQAVLNTLTTGTGGIDTVEGQTAALHAVATGKSIGCGVAAAACPAGTFGYPCFRNKAQPIVVLLTDAGFHNGVWDTQDPPAPGSCYEYASGGCTSACLPLTVPCPSLETVVTELNTAKIKVIGVHSGWPNYLGRVNTWAWGYPPAVASRNDVGDLYYTVENTGSRDAAGVPFLFGIASDGSGIGAEIVNGIDALVKELLLDVRSDWHDEDATAPDGKVLVNDVDPVACSACASLDSATNTAFGAPPGSTVTFDVILENQATDIPPTAAAQEFTIHIQLLGNDASVLADQYVHVLVPGTEGVGQPPVAGRYWNDFARSDTCEAWQTVHWERLYADMDTPAGTSITFSARTADDQLDLDAAPPVALTTTYNAMLDLYEADLQAPLGVDTTKSWLRIQAGLGATVPGTTPTLYSMTVRHYCL